ncbi:MAG: tyrosine-type recombinase/integrase [Balneolaceae bacterium]
MKRKLTDAFIKEYETDKRLEIYDSLKGVSGLVLRVTPTGHKSFALRYWYDGQSKQYTIGRYGTWSLAEARAETKELKKLIDKGIDPAVQKKNSKESKPKTLKQAIEDYKKMHLPSLKQSTQADYKNRIKSIVKGEGIKKTKARGFDGSRYIKDIKRHEVYDFLEGIARTAPTNAQRIQAILSGIFKFAKNREWIDSNPVNEISLRRDKKNRKTKWQNLAFNDSQIKKLWDEFDQHIEPVSSFFKMLLITGQRAGETRNMKWSDIDFDNQLWSIPATDTKNGIEHYVPLSSEALETLEKLQYITNGKFVFESPVNKGHPIGHPQKTAQRIRKKKNGVKEFNIHSLRTTFATRLAGSGTPPQVLSKILNHKKPGEGSTITAIYNKYDYEEEKRIALNRWSLELKQILTGEKAKVYPIKSGS